MSKMRPIGSARVLLVNLSPSGQVGTTLGEILTPYFSLKAADFSSAGDEVATNNGDLSRLILRSNPAIVFVGQAANRPKQTREFLELMQKDFPAIPVIV